MQVEKDSLYRRTEGLLREYRAMKARVEILESELSKQGGDGVTETPDEAIEGDYFARVISDMPHGTEISDKTARVALEYWERYQKDIAAAVKRYVLDRENKRNELAAIEQTIQVIDIAIRSLLEVEREVVTQFYIEGLSWTDISINTQYTVRNCKRLRDRGVWYMTKSMMGKWRVY